jgi:hypothetical protein
VARKLAIPKTTFWGWCRGKNLPPLAEVIHICNKYGINIVDFYKGLYKEGHTPVIFSKRVMKRNVILTKRPLTEIRKLVKCIVMDKTIEYHVQAMADVVGCNKKTLYNHFPNLCKAQAVKRKRYLKKQKWKRLVEIKREVTAVFKLTSSYANVPGINRLERYLNKPAIFREREMKDHLNKLIVGGEP